MRCLLALFCLCGLLRQSGGTLQAETVDYTDALGRHVRIQAPVRRAVVLQFWEILPALRCWDRVAAVSSQASSWDFMLRSQPNLLKMSSAGTGNDPNIEMLLKLRPDLVVTSNFRPEHVRFMERMGLTVIALNPNSIAEMCGIVDLEGKLFGRRDEAQRAIGGMEEVLALVEHRSGNLPGNKRKKVLSLSLRPDMVGGGSGITNDMIARIGAENVAGGIAEHSPVVSIESVVGWSPDVIFIAGNANYQKRNILDNPQWRFIKAVREQQVYKTPRWNTWSPRVALVVLWMAAKTYPELYRDVDVRSVADRFHQLVFLESLADTELNDF